MSGKTRFGNRPAVGKSLLRAAAAAFFFASAAFTQELPQLAIYISGSGINEGTKAALESQILASFVGSGGYRGAPAGAALVAEINKARQARGGVIDLPEIGRIARNYGVSFVCIVDVTHVAIVGEYMLSVRVFNAVTTATELTGTASARSLSTADDVFRIWDSTVRSLQRAPAPPPPPPAPPPPPPPPAVVSLPPSALPPPAQVAPAAAVAQSPPEVAVSQPPPAYYAPETAAAQTPPPSAKPKIAVYVSEHSGYSGEEKSALRTATLSALVRSGKYEVVERTSVLDAELEKQASGDVDDDQLVAFGKQRGARYVCVSDMLSPFGTRYVARQEAYTVQVGDKTETRYRTVQDPYVDFQLSARIIDVETAEVTALGVQTLSNLGSDRITAITGAVNKMLETVSSSGGAEPKLPTMAVYLTGGSAGSQAGNILYTYVLDAIFTRSRSNGDFKVVERADAFTKQIDREQLKQRSGDVDDGQISRLGKQYGVERILVASIDNVDNRYQITARLVRVETASVEMMSQIGYYSQKTDMENCRVLAVNIVEEMIKRKISSAEIAAEQAYTADSIRREEAYRDALKEAQRTGWRFSGSFGGGVSLMMKDIDTLFSGGGGQFSVNVEWLKSNLRFLRIGFNLDWGGSSVDKALREQIIDEVKANTSPDSGVWVGGMSFRMGPYVRLQPLDFLYLSAGAGLGWYGIEVHSRDSKVKGGRVTAVPMPTLVCPLGAGIVIPFELNSWGGLALEGYYNMVPAAGAGFLSINAMIHFGRGGLISPPQKPYIRPREKKVI